MPKTEIEKCPCGGKTLICKPLGGISGWVLRCEKTCCFEMGSHPNWNTPEHLEKLITAWNTREGGNGVCADCNYRKLYTAAEKQVKELEMFEKIVRDMYPKYMVVVDGAVKLALKG